VRVVDSGSGIPEEIMDSIFDVFYTTKKNGTGMGLSISRNIIEAHGGDLVAYNNEGTGATFIMKLPLQVLDQ
jgi:signal transduction histidine kinase